MRPFIALLIALLLPSTALSAKSSDTASHVFSARVTVSESGEVSDFKVDPRYRAVEASVAEVVRKWRFEPARLGGKPVALDTTLVLRLDTRPDGQGRLLAEVSLEGNGGGAEKMPPPRYPHGALRDQASGIVLLEVAYDADGKVTGTHVVQSVATRKVHRAAFDQAAQGAARGWTMRPERVNGIGMPGVVFVPITFQAQGGKVPKLPPSPELQGLAGDPDVLLSRSELPLTRADAEG